MRQAQKKYIIVSIASCSLSLLNVNLVQAKQSKAASDTNTQSGTPLTSTDKQHILTENFALVKTVQAIPESVRLQLLGNGVWNGMADAGQPFETSDMVGPKPLPFRRLIFAGLSTSYCLVYNEYGGFGCGTQAALYHVSTGNAVLVWRASLNNSSKLLDLPQLRDAISKGKYYNEQLPKQPQGSD